jgi:predicted  nucleic acid-binding Zn-ribbon protein
MPYTDIKCVYPAGLKADVVCWHSEFLADQAAVMNAFIHQILNILQQVQNRSACFQLHLQALEADVARWQSEIPAEDDEDSINIYDKKYQAAVTLTCLSLNLQRIGCLQLQLQALEADVARWQSEIPADTAAAESLGQQLEEAEAKLEALQDSIKGEVEGYHQQMSKVRLM